MPDSFEIGDIDRPLNFGLELRVALLCEYLHESPRAHFPLWKSRQTNLPLGDLVFDLDRSVRRFGLPVRAGKARCGDDFLFPPGGVLLRLVFLSRSGPPSMPTARRKGSGTITLSTTR